MAAVHVEVLAEPFRENDPGAHVAAVVEALNGSGLDADMGPFATTASGDLDTVAAAVAALLRSSFDAGATAIQLRVELAG